MKQLIAIACLLAAAVPLAGQTISDYTAYPPFLGQTVMPNILIVQDMTGSMAWRASYLIDGGAYKPNKSYYGYFKPDSMYSYASNRFYSDASGKFSGNLLNWAIMSRCDIARKVMIGGKGNPRTGSFHTLTSEGADSGWGSGNRDTVTVDVGGSITTYRIDRTATSTVAFIRISGANPGALAGSYTTKVDVRAVEDRGVVHNLADKDGDGQWDANAPRFGLMLYSTSYGQNIKTRGSYITGTGMLSSFLTGYENNGPAGGTPVGNAVYEAACYYSQRAPRWANDYTETPGGADDPMYDNVSGSVYRSIPCRKNFVLLITDGESNSDTKLTTDASMPAGPFARDLYDYNGVWHNYDDCSGGGDNDHPADDYAYYAHITDLRQSGARDIGGMQNVTYYAISTFGAGGALMKEVAKWGGFTDKNNDNIPQANEYDINSDGIPDAYFEANDGQELEIAIIKAVTAMLQSTASASAVSIAATPGSGEGSMYQAYFQPSMVLSDGSELLWSGYFRALWTDRYGNLREDTDNDMKLDMLEDYVFRNKLGTDSIFLYQDIDGYGGLWPGGPLVKVAQTSVNGIKDVWNGGKWLYNNTPAVRNIFTNIPGIGKTNFSSGGVANPVRQYIGAASNAQADSVIDYIRGTDYTGWRPRKADLTNNVWKLGDIIYSSPVYFGKPAERFDLLYNDNSYNAYYQKYLERGGVTLIGANDGMLHAFNAGRFVPETGINTKGHLIGDELGKERWAYVPFNLLPHLKWLKDRLYPHTYYVDLKPKVTDARIFSATPNSDGHVNGWGTIVVGAMRLGGGEIKNPINAADTLRSAYFCIDVSDSTNPVPLWEFDNDTLCFTTSYPAVATIGNTSYAIFGSGPGTYDGITTTIGSSTLQRPKLWVLNLLTGAPVASFVVPDDSSAIGDITSVDIDMNGKCDAVYFGTYSRYGRAKGKLWRLCLRSTPNLAGTETNTAASWSLGVLCDVKRPVIAAPVVSADTRSRGWVYFGTGRYYCDSDESDSVQQAFFGVRDTKFSTNISNINAGFNGLIDVTDCAVYIYKVGENLMDSVKFGTRSMSYNALVDTVNKFQGWHRRLNRTLSVTSTYQAERVLSRPVVGGGAVIFTTFQPSSDVCGQGGDGFMYGLYYLTGTAFADTIIRDPAAQGVKPGDVAIKIHLGSGMPSAPTISISKGSERGSTEVVGLAMGADGAPRQIRLKLPNNPVSGQIYWKRY